MAAARLNILSTAAEDTYVQPKLSGFVLVHADTSSTLTHSECWVREATCAPHQLNGSAPAGARRTLILGRQYLRWLHGFLCRRACTLSPWPASPWLQLQTRDPVRSREPLRQQ